MEFSECFREAKARLTIPQLWEKLCLPGEPKKKCCSPFREEKNPSFSITHNDTRWRDHGSNQGGDIFDFYQAATDCSKADAVREVFKLLNMKAENPGYGWSKPKAKRSILSYKQIEIGPKLIDFACELPPQAVEFLLGKGINPYVAMDLIREGSLDMEAGKFVYCYNTGKKLRPSWETSKDNRWIEGGAEDALWRYEQVIRPEVSTVLICEGESDCMRVLSVTDIPCHVAVVAAPAASWRPSEILCSTIGHGRKVVLAFDNDEAGACGTREVAKLMDEACNYDVTIEKWPWKQIDNILQLTGHEPVKDLCELPQNILLQIIDAVFFND